MPRQYNDRRLFTEASAENRSAQESQALMLDLVSFKDWSTGIELTGKVTTGMLLLAAEHMFRGQSALVVPSGPL